ncbi:hypothetical protein [Thaumasiovibrio subtropicus]|uniref:hypothetical protein n=1 Tax=Thaumasiovibrio subtropicus TaxID=1891207 RepID=UPI000B35FF08|nr:hypothetical protein [Thaumasiovibrio subtropicus]
MADIVSGGIWRFFDGQDMKGRMKLGFFYSELLLRDNHVLRFERNDRQENISVDGQYAGRIRTGFRPWYWFSCKYIKKCEYEEPPEYIEVEYDEQLISEELAITLLMIDAIRLDQ